MACFHEENTLFPKKSRGISTGKRDKFCRIAPLSGVLATINGGYPDTVTRCSSIPHAEAPATGCPEPSLGRIATALQLG